ncbi:serine protease persephone-like [Hetaerina americana]|uniref:serine protease persephone-like n=1 Tax=Hetaerina americana TaxID=62018 RepID=UPI003A7F5031
MGTAFPAGRISSQSTATTLLLALVLCSTVTLARFVAPRDNSVGGVCRLGSGRRGECRLITECPSALAAIRRTSRQGQPNTNHPRCGFKGNIEIVCCEPRSDSGNRQSGGVRYNPGSRDPNLGQRKPWLQGGGGRPQYDSQWLPGTNRGGRPTTTHQSQTSERRAAAACRVYSSQCPNNVSPYIIDGTVAGLGEIPHMAALGYNENVMGQKSLKWDCGGSLISDRYVMTAAHCTRMVNGAPVVVRLGDQDLVRDDEGATPIDFAIEKIEMHPSYSSNTSYNDIALLRLERSVNFSQFICPACLYMGEASSVRRRGNFDIADRINLENGEDTSADSFQQDSPASSDYELSNRLLWNGEEVGPRLNNEDDLRDKNLFVSGWGATSFPGGDRSPVLLMAKIEPFSSGECNASLFEAIGRSIPLIPRGIFPDVQVCAGDKNGKKDTCVGDSGGPLQFKSKESSSLLTVVGITSFGSKCGQSLPGVYTRVSSYLDWIEQKVWPQGPPS